MATEFYEVLVSEIQITNRFRKDVGDITSLCESIKEVGLLHPIVLTTHNMLVSGMRRVEAFKRLGMKVIPACVVDNIESALLLLKAERDENTCRKEFTPTEAVALGVELEKLEKPKAKAAQANAIKERDSKGRAKSTSDKLSEVDSPTNGKHNPQTRDKVGEAVGMSGATYQRAKAVVQSGKQELIDEMDSTGKVLGPYKKLMAEEDNRETPEVLGVGIQRAHEAIACLKRIPRNDGLRKEGFDTVMRWIKHNK